MNPKDVVAAKNQFNYFTNFKLLCQPGGDMRQRLFFQKAFVNYEYQQNMPDEDFLYHET